MADSKPKPWTEAEKLGLFFQIIEKAGSIPWDSLDLPEGRTKKACIVMIDRERQKAKKAKGVKGAEAAREGDAEGKKRKAVDTEVTDGAKRSKTPRKPFQRKYAKAEEDYEPNLGAAAEDGETTHGVKDDLLEEDY